MKKQKVAIYARVSTEMQEEKDALQRQINRCKSYCEFKDLDVYKIYTDVESGAKDDRTAFLELQEAVQNKEFDILVVTELSRISRKLKTLLEFLEELQDKEIDFVSLLQNIDTTSAIGRAMFKVIGVFAEFEREQTAERVKHTMHNIARSGRFVGGVPPLGYKSVDKHLVIDEVKAPIIKEIFEMYIKGTPKKQISETTEIPNSSISRIINNKMYTGKMVYGKRRVNTKGKIEKVDESDYLVIDGLHEAIIDEGTFEMAQKIYNSNYKKQIRTEDNPDYLLGGKIKCYCEYNMYGSKSSWKRKDGLQTKFYICSKKSTKNVEKCKKKNINSEEFEEEILIEILRLKNTNNIFESLNKLKDKKGDNDFVIKKNFYIKEIDKLEKKKDSLLDLFLDSELSKELYKKKEAQILSKINQFKNELDIINDRLNYKTLAVNNKEYFLELLNKVDRNLKRNELKTLLSILIKKIQFINDFEYEIYFNI